MEQSYTDLDLIRFIYGEVEIFEYFEMDFAIAENPDLRAEYKALKESMELLPKVKHSPSVKSLNNILAYSSKSAIATMA